MGLKAPGDGLWRPLRGLEIAPGFWLLAALGWALDGEAALLTALAALGHELGHCLALRRMGVPIRGLRLTGLGAELRPDRPLSYRQELPAALAGPAASLALAWGAARLRLFLFAGLSLALGVGNLLPVYPLDGGRALRSLCALTLPAPWDTALPRAAALLTALAVLAGGLLGARAGLPWLILPGLWLTWQLREAL